MDIIPPKTTTQEEAIQLLPINEVARQLSISHMTLRRWDKSGKLKAIRLTSRGKRFYKKSDVQACIIPKIRSFQNETGETKASTAQIALKDFGSTFESQQDGQKAWNKIQSFLTTIQEDDTIEVDFAEVPFLGIDWAEAFLSPLHEKYGNRLQLKNVDDGYIHLVTLEIIGLYHPHRLPD